MALIDIDGAADALVKIADGMRADGNGVAYIAAQLRQHYERAHDAMCKAFKMDDYREGATTD